MTPRQERFISEYLVDLCGAKAAIRAGYSAKTAKEQASRLLTNANVRAAIENGKASQLERAELSADRVLEELRRVAFSNLVDFFDVDGNLKPVQDLTPEQGSGLASLELILKNAEGGNGKVDRVLKLKLCDKLRALELLAKHYGLLVERLDYAGEVQFRWQSEEFPNS